MPRYLSLDCKSLIEIHLKQGNLQVHDQFREQHPECLNGNALSSKGLSVLERWRIAPITELVEEAGPWIVFPRMSLLSGQLDTYQWDRALILNLINYTGRLTQRGEELIRETFKRSPRSWIAFISDAVRRDRVPQRILADFVDIVAYEDWASVLALDNFNAIAGVIRNPLLKLLQEKRTTRDTIA